MSGSQAKVSEDALIGEMKGLPLWLKMRSLRASALDPHHRVRRALTAARGKRWQPQALVESSVYVHRFHL